MKSSQCLEPHAYEHDPSRRNATILALDIEPQWLRSFRPNSIASGAPGCFGTATGVVDQPIRTIAHDLVDEMVAMPYGSAAEEALSSSLVIAVISRFTPRRDAADARWPIAIRSVPHRRIRKAIETMRADPAAPRSRARARRRRLARAAGLSRAHFFRLSDRSAGMTPHTFLNVVRVERAVRAVAETETSAATIGNDLALFESLAQFSRTRRDHVSVSP